MNYVSLNAQNTTNALLFGTRWGVGVDMTAITYSFPGLNSTWVDYTNPGEPYQGFTSFSAYEQQAVRNTLLAWSSVANLSFTEMADDAGGNGTIRIAYTSHLMDANQLGYAYLPDDLASGGDVWLNAGLQNTTFQSLEPGTMGGFTLLHELGHALGLKHSAEASAYSSATLGTLEDTIFNTVMSFNAMPGVPLTLAGNIDRLPSTPMSYDIDALQYTYGANTTTHSGDDRYVFADNGKYLQTIYDAGGNDTIELTGTQGGTIDLRPGAWSKLGIPVQINGGAIQNPDTVRIYRTTTIENAIGSDGADTLIGNDAANTIQGNAGNDTLIGGAGCDTLTGGTGADCYILATDAQDIITDFSLGDGDRLELGQIIASFIGYTAGSDLFANGYLSLSQQGNDTLIAFDTDGTATTDTTHSLVTFQNFSANSLNNASFIQGIAGSITLSATIDSVPGGSSTTLSLPTPGSVAGTIDVADMAGGADADWYRVSLTAGTTYQFDLTSSTLDGILAIYDATGFQLAYADGWFAGIPESLSYNPALSGLYYVSASGWGGTTGDFTLSAAVDSVPGGSSTTLSLGTPGSVSGTIETTDVVTGLADEDWYQVSLTAGATYQFDMTSATLDGVLKIYDTPGVQLAYADSGITGDPESLSFSPTTSGSYYVSVSGWGGYTTGSFTLTATGGAVDSVPGGSSTTLSLPTPGSVTGMIDVADMAGGADKDWYQVSLTAGATYQFDMTSATLDGVLKIYDTPGVQLAYADSGITGDPESLSFSPTTSGSYYVSVSGWGGYTTGSFTLSVAVAATGGAVDTVGDWYTDTNVGTIAATGSVSGSIDNSYDGDWYAVQLTAGQNYLFSLSSAAPLDTSLSLYDANGWYLNSSWTYQGDESLFFSAASTGTYYLAVYGDYTNTGSFILTSSTATTGGGGADSIPDNTTTSATLAVGGSVNGTINSSTDYGDWYGVSLLGNTTYRFDLSAALLDGQLGLYDANGMYLSWADSGWAGDPEALAYTTVQAGTYYIGVSGYGGSAGDFQLGLSQLSAAGGTVDNVGGSSGTAGFINVPGQVSGTIDNGTDTDWYAVTLNANTLYQFDLSSFFIDGILALYDANGIQQSYMDSGLHVGDPESMYYTPATAGTYYVAVSGYGGTTGSFQLDAIGYASQAGDFVADSSSTTAAVSMPGTVWGVIDSADSTGGDDADWYSVRLNAGSTYRIDLFGDSNLDGVLTLYGADGASWLDSADAGYMGGSEYFYYSPTVTGDYYIAVDGWSNTTGEFWLSVAQTSGASTTADTVGQTAGTSVSVAVSQTAPGHVNGTINDNADADWYAVTLAANTQYEFNLGSISLDGILQLYDASGNELAYADNGWFAGDPENLVYTTSATGGTYYIGVSGYGGSTGDFLLDIYSSGTVSNADSVGDTYLTAAQGLLNIGGSAVRGQVDTGADEDVYSVVLTANTTYLFDLSSTSLDGTLTLYGSAGEWLDSADYGWTGGAEYLYFTPSISGNYYISAGGWSSSTGSYDLSATALAAEIGDVPGNATSTTNLPVPGFVDNQIGSSIDSDWFSIRMNQGNEYIFDLYSNDGLLDGILQIFDANGNPVYDQYGNGYADNGWYAGDAEHLYFTAPATGDYFIGVSGYGGTAGSYSLYSSEAVAAAAVDWTNFASYLDIKWNVLDWVSWDMAAWLAFDWNAVYADYVNWNQLQYEHVYDATDPTTGYTAWDWNFTTTNPGNEQVIGGAANDIALLGIGLDYFSGDLGNDSADGGEGADHLDGGAGSDILNGGSGNDMMIGGLGADTYFVDSTGDSVFEADNTLTGAPAGFRLALDLGSNIDTVIASISYTLGNYLENLDLAAGSGNLTGTGNALDNVLIGNEGNNTLTGAGGNDTFVFAANGNGIDTITDFSAGDSITVTGTAFSGMITAGDGSTVLANQVQLAAAGGTTTLYIGTDSTASADIQIQLTGTFAANTFALYGNTIALNNIPTGSVTISGATTQGQTLTANTTTLADLDGLGTLSYQWQANGTDIAGATGSTYLLTQAEVGKTITAVASYTDLHGTAESVTSNATSAVANVNDTPIGAVTITGTATQGQTLTAGNTLADADGLGTIGYQWKADSIAISGATNNTYTLTETEVGKAISVVASYTDLYGTVEAVTSSSTANVYILLPSKYFVTLSPGSNLLDFDLAYGSLSLQGQELVFTGTNGIDNVTVAPGVIFDFTKSNGGIDNIHLTGNLTDYTTAYTTSTVTLSRGTGASAETVLLAKGTASNYDAVVFANGAASTFDLHGWAAGGALPTLSAAPALPTTLNATVKGFALDATGETFTGTSPGINFIATGGNGVDIVYVKAGATVDASKLNSGEDKIYLTGNWADYTKTATSTKITFTNGTETVIVAAATGASNDRLIFADGYVLSNDAKTALLSNANAAIATVAGYSTTEVTPLGTGDIVSGTTAADTLNGTAAADILYGGGGADTLNGGAGSDTIVITDAGTTASSSATILLTSIANGTDTLIGFSAAAVADGGDVLDFSAIASLTDAVATGQTLATDFAAGNVFIFDNTPVTIADAANAIANDASVVATDGYIVLADSANHNAVTVYHSADLTGNTGVETALVILSGVSITSLTAGNFLV